MRYPMGFQNKIKNQGMGLLLFRRQHAPQKMLCKSSLYIPSKSNCTVKGGNIHTLFEHVETSRVYTFFTNNSSSSY